MCWLIVSYVTVWLPNYSRVFGPFFSSWNAEELLQRIEKAGGWYASLVPQFLKSWHRGFLGQIVFTYSIMYISLPGYFSPNKNKLPITLITLSLIGLFFLYSFNSLHTNYTIAVQSGLRPYMPDNWFIITVMIKGMAFALPTILGLAVTIKLLKRWWIKQKQTEELAKEKVRAELQLLKAQVHPHFLFNTLNNIYFFTLSRSPQAPEMIKKLTDMLRYILDECDYPLVPLEKELKMIKDYMTLEKIRYGEQMEMIINIKGSYTKKMISPLLLIPFIENSFKHGASKMLTHPSIKLAITIEGNDLLFFLTNKTPVKTNHDIRNGNIGLKNVRKRLQLLYPAAHELTIASEENMFSVVLKIQLEEMNSVNPEKESVIENYEMA